MTVKSPDVATRAQATKPKRDGGVQPRKQAPKSRVVVKMRRKKIIKAILEGKTQQQAGIIAGFKPENAGKQVSLTLQNPSVQNALVAAMEKIGVTDDMIAERLHTLLHGTKVISATVIAPGSGADLKEAGSMTKDFIEVPDNAALAKGIEIACKVKGHFTEKHEVDVKRHVTVVIQSFCPEDDPLMEGATT